MKVLTKELRTIQQGLSEIVMIELPVKPSYWLARILNKTNSEVKTLELARMKLIEKWSELDESGNPLLKKDKDGNPLAEYDLTAEKKIEFEKEYAELLEIEIDLEFDEILLSSLGNAKIKPVIFIKLQKIIVEAKE